MFWRTDKKGTGEKYKEIKRPYLVFPSAKNYQGYDHPFFCILKLGNNECEISHEFKQKPDEKLTLIGYD